MKLQVVVVVSLLALLTACGTTNSANPSSGSSLNTGSANSAAGSGDLSGNWQFAATSSLVNATTGLVGYITQSGTAFQGTVHVFGTNCYDYFTNVNFNGAVNGQQAQFSTSSVNGQVLTVNSTVSGTSFNSIHGTYTLAGGCGNGDSGNFTGYRIPSLTGQWSGSLTGSSPIALQAALTQGGPDTTFGAATLTGTVSASNTSCFSTGTISVGHAAGTSISAIVTMNSGTLYLAGYTDSTGKTISGTYNISNGVCSGQSGNFTLATN